MWGTRAPVPCKSLIPGSHKRGQQHGPWSGERPPPFRAHPTLFLPWRVPGKGPPRGTWLPTLACSAGPMCRVSGWGQGLTFLHSHPWLALGLHSSWPLSTCWLLIQLEAASYLHPITVPSSFLPFTISIPFLPQSKSLVTCHSSRQVRPSKPRV